MRTEYGDAWYKHTLNNVTSSDSDLSLRYEYLRQWDELGASRISCYLRDNFVLKSNAGGSDVAS